MQKDSEYQYGGLEKGWINPSAARQQGWADEIQKRKSGQTSEQGDGRISSVEGPPSEEKSDAIMKEVQEIYGINSAEWPEAIKKLNTLGVSLQRMLERETPEGRERLRGIAKRLLEKIMDELG